MGNAPTDERWLPRHEEDQNETSNEGGLQFPQVVLSILRDKDYASPFRDFVALPLDIMSHTDSLEYITKNFHLLSPDAQDEILKIVKQSLAGTWKAATNKPSIYDKRKEGEPAHEFIMRTWKNRPLYRGKKIDGDIISFIRRTYQDKGYLDGLLFTRATLRKLDTKADSAIENWLTKNKTLPDDLPLPAKKGLSKGLAGHLSPEELRAARSLANQLL